VDQIYAVMLGIERRVDIGHLGKVEPRGGGGRVVEECGIGGRFS